MKEILFVVCGSLTIIAMFLFGAIASAKQSQKAVQKTFNECKERSTDTEWCMRLAYKDYLPQQ